MEYPTLIEISKKFSNSNAQKEFLKVVDFLANIEETDPLFQTLKLIPKYGNLLNDVKNFNLLAFKITNLNYHKFFKDDYIFLMKDDYLQSIYKEKSVIIKLSFS